MTWKYFIIHPIEHLVSLSIERRHYLRANQKELTMPYLHLEYDLSRPTHNEWLLLIIVSSNNGWPVTHSRPDWFRICPQRIDCMVFSSEVWLYVLR